MPIPPPAKPLLLSLAIDRLRLTVPQWVGLVLLAVLVPSGVWLGLGDSRGTSPAGPVPVGPPVALQASTAAAFPPVVAMLGRLPDGVDTQRKPPCDPEMEHAIGGWCWIPLDAKPCPKGKAWEHEGRCYLRALRAARSPTTGEPRTTPVANPAE